MASQTEETSSSDEETNAGEVHIGNCGDPFKFPAQKPDGNPWEFLLKPLVAKDRQRCDIWKEEVENLLIFAGLFSAVVTAFVVETYKQLQPDPNDIMISLLAQIVVSLDGNRNDTSRIDVPAAIANVPTPSSSIGRVNALWFISLVLSLTDVLIGTVALQWLRAYLRYPVEMDARTKFAMFNMRREGLEAWYVPYVFSALPMILQVSLLLFFWGLIEFLILFAPAAVLVPVVLSTAIPILFLFGTTILPSFQWIVHPRIYVKLWNKIPSECPYNSPQSSALKFISPLLCRFLDFFDRKTGGWLDYWSDQDISFDSELLALKYRGFCYELLHGKNVGAVIERRAEFDDLWKEYQPKFSAYGRNTPVYDWMRGLQSARIEGNKQVSVEEACYSCIQDVIGIKQHNFESYRAWCYFLECAILEYSTHSRPWSKRARYQVLESHYEHRSIPDEVVQEDLYMVTLESLFTERYIDNHASKLSIEHMRELHIRLMKCYIPTILEKDTKRNAEGWYPPEEYITFSDKPLWNYTGDGYTYDISKGYTELLKDLVIGITRIRTPIGQGVWTDSILPEKSSLIRYIEVAMSNQDHKDRQQTLLFMKTYVSEQLRINPFIAQEDYPFALFFFVALYCGALLRTNRETLLNINLSNVLFQLSRFKYKLRLDPVFFVGTGEKTYSSFLEACEKIYGDKEPDYPPVEHSDLQRDFSDSTSSLRYTLPHWNQTAEHANVAPSNAEPGNPVLDAESNLQTSTQEPSDSPNSTTALAGPSGLRADPEGEELHHDSTNHASSPSSGPGPTEIAQPEEPLNAAANDAIIDIVPPREDDADPDIALVGHARHIGGMEQGASQIASIHNHRIWDDWA